MPAIYNRNRVTRLQIPNVQGTSLVVEDEWGPYRLRNRQSVSCTIQVVKRLSKYRNLPNRFLIGIDMRRYARFICDIPPGKCTTWLKYVLSNKEPNRRSTEAWQKWNEMVEGIDEHFEEVVQKFYK